MGSQLGRAHWAQLELAVDLRAGGVGDSRSHCWHRAAGDACGLSVLSAFPSPLSLARLNLPPSWLCRPERGSISGRLFPPLLVCLTGSPVLASCLARVTLGAQSTPTEELPSPDPESSSPPAPSGLYVAPPSPLFSALWAASPLAPCRRASEAAVLTPRGFQPFPPPSFPSLPSSSVGLPSGWLPLCCSLALVC